MEGRSPTVRANAPAAVRGPSGDGPQSINLSAEGFCSAGIRPPSDRLLSSVCRSRSFSPPCLAIAIAGRSATAGHFPLHVPLPGDLDKVA